MPALVITRDQIIASGACSLRTLEKRAGAGGNLVYPNGFNAVELASAATNNPRELAWLVSHGLVPCGIGRARAAILRAHGPDAFTKIFGTSGRLSGRTRTPARQPTPQAQSDTKPPTDPSSGTKPPTEPSSGTSSDPSSSSTSGKSSKSQK